MRGTRRYGTPTRQRNGIRKSSHLDAVPSGQVVGAGQRRPSVIAPARFGFGALRQSHSKSCKLRSLASTNLCRMIQLNSALAAFRCASDKRLA